MIVLLAAAAMYFSFSAFEPVENDQLQKLNSTKHYNSAFEIVKNHRLTASFSSVELFTVNQIENHDALSSFVSKASFLKIDGQRLQEINRSKPGNMTFKVPGSDGNIIEAELVRVDLLKEDFRIKLINAGSETLERFEGGLYYSGIIKGDETSIVSVSIFKDNVIGIYSTSTGNYVLGTIKDENKRVTSDYMFYNEADALNAPGFECGAGDTYNEFYRGTGNISNGNSIKSSNRTTSPIDIYFVCDYKMYQDNGSNQNQTSQFVTGAFLHVKTLYTNEQIPVEISQIGVYTGTDPYANLTSSTAILEAFGTQTKNDFEGDLAHLLSTRQAGFGGIAWIDVLCQSYEPTSQSGRYAFSNIDNEYLPYPVYSWTVMVITHETGHNIGSMHTHACVWPTVSGQIDSCYASEGGCVNGTRTNNNGTVMSYCHLNGAINLTRGFGPLPGDTIRAGYNNALCLDNPLNSSEQPLDFVLLQNYPNPFNPSTNIKFALPEAGLVTLRVYDLTGREVAKLINSAYYPIGIFGYTLDASYYNLASGVYMYKLDVSRENNAVYSEIKKMVLVK